MKILGFEVPIPDTLWAEFAFTLFLWALAGAFIILVLAPLLVMVTRRTKSRWDTLILKAIRIPGFVFIIVFGWADSLGILTQDVIHSDGEIKSAPLSANAMNNLIMLLDIILVVVTAWLIYRIFHRVIVPLFKDLSTRTETKLDDVMMPLIEKLGSVVIVIFAFTGIMDKLGINPGVALAGMGVAGLVIAFAAQDTLSNFFSGLHLMLDRPFDVGDTILLDEKERADVLDIGLRSCKLYDRRLNTLVIMPNNRIASSKITNLTKPDPYFRISIKVNVAYSSDPGQVRDILYDIAKAHPHVLDDETRPIRSRFLDFGDSALEFVLICWVDDVNLKENYAAEMRHSIYHEFKKNDIKIPFPQRVLHAAPGNGAELAKLGSQLTQGSS